MMAEPELTADSSAEVENVFSKLPTILWERRWLILIPLVLGTIAGVAAAFLLPSVYQSKAVLLVESQQLSGQTQQPVNPNAPSVIDRRMASIRQQILSRPDLVELIQTHNLYNASSRAQPLSKLVEQMRDATVIRAVDANIDDSGSRGRAGSSIAFELSFEYPRPGLSQLVAQTFVDRLLKLDASRTESEALNNVRYQEDQQTQLRDRLTQIETQITRITGVNGAALSAAASPGMMVMNSSNFEGQIAQLERENTQLRAQINSTALERDPGVVAAESRLAAVRATYADNHPDVKMAESQLAAARQTAAAVQSKGVSGVVEQQIRANNSTISQLRAAQGAERARASQMAAAAARGPAVAQQVEQLRAEADSVRANLGRVEGTLLAAQSQVKVSQEQRGERLTLIEPPVTPDMPSSPNRPLLVAGGLAGGAGLGIVLALLLELVLRPIRSVATLARITGEPPLAVVPVLSKKRYRARKGRKFGRRRAEGMM